MRKAFFYSFVLVSFLAMLMVSWLFYIHYKKIKAQPVTAWTQDHRADCGIVLTGAINRIPDAFEQLYLKRVKKLIISGVNPKTTLQDIFPHRYFYGDLDEGDIILEKTSLTTYGNAQQSLPFVEALNCRDVVLITSKLHMPRAYRTFRNHFPKDIPIYQRATVGKAFKAHPTRVGVEALKSLFYDLWLY